MPTKSTGRLPKKVWWDRVWPASAARCDTCNKRRNTYQLRDDDFGNDALCAECLSDKLRGSPEFVLAKLRAAR